MDKKRKSRFSELTNDKVNEEVAKVTQQDTARGKGRPRNTKKPFTSSLEPEHRAKLHYLSVLKEQSISESLEQILDYYFENVENVTIPRIQKKN